ncbi:MAG TPA: YlxM family DNA-binding protein [Clostridia bacterium]|nr:YlxM family DNA-binding protein [Clostridia bacterium]
MLAKMTRIAWLYSFYGSLLTERQRSLVELYYHQDYSLAEIAALEGVSRQAVHDLLKRAESALEEYEASLHLFSKHLQQQELVEQIRALLSAGDVDRTLVEEVSRLLTKLLEVYQEA